MSDDLEKECWTVYRECEKPVDKLAALKLLVTIRCAGPKVKGEDDATPSDGRAGIREQVLREMLQKAGKG
jgi:hypothetical protein